jgi:hypothetical protein
MKRLFFFLTIIFAATCATAQTADRVDASDGAPDARPFSLRVADLQTDPGALGGFAGGPATIQAASATPYRSPLLAGIFSLLIPGAGEIYAESYWRAAIFIAAEAAFWYYNISNNKKGDDQTDLFQRYADQHWSLVRYAEWLNAYAKTFPGGDKAVPIRIDQNTALPPWERVNWDDLHITESVIPEFSHRLPAHGDQQYYELIGKYQQYNHGWDDSDPNTAIYYTNVTARFHEYSGMRGKANSFYNTASTFAAVIVINHVLSALDAAWSAAIFNDRYRITSRLELRATPTAYEAVPTAQLQIFF